VHAQHHLLSLLDGQCARTERLTVCVEELRFRPAQAAARAPCLLTVQVRPGATPQEVHLVDVTGYQGGTGGGDAGNPSRHDAQPDAVGGRDACAAAGGEALGLDAEALHSSAALVQATPQLRPGDSYTFHLDRPGARCHGTISAGAACTPHGGDCMALQAIRWRLATRAQGHSMRCVRVCRCRQTLLPETHPLCPLLFCLQARTSLPARCSPS
jgi:hypothetical protein